MNVQKCPLSHEERHNMIAESAFFKSEHRVRPGDPLQDWLDAEAELEEALAAQCRSVEQDKELSAYWRIRHDVRRILEKAEDSVTAETIAQALAKAKAELLQKGEFLPATIDRAAKAVKHEIGDTLDKLEHRWESYRSKQEALLANWKVRGSHALREWLERWRNKVDH
jgi:acetylornithine deacetylase/succinyl-diaminopimelate desuccinylase-like protein